jgi:hypothetical protein
MSKESGRSPATQGRAGAPSGLSRDASQAEPLIPNAEQVADALRWLGGRTSAVALCTILEIRGFDRANAQLGMQRAWDCNSPTIRVMDDWTLALASGIPTEGGDVQQTPFMGSPTGAAGDAQT